MRGTLLQALLGLLLGGLLLLIVPREAKAGREVRVGVFQVEPLTFVGGGRPQGLFVELLEEVAAQEGWALQYEEGTFEQQFKRLNQGELDVMPTIAWSADRLDKLDYSSESVITLWGEVFVREGEPVPGLLELRGRRVALMRSDINGNNFRKHIARFDIECHLVEVDTLSAVFTAVRDGRADAGVAPNIFGYRHAAAYQVVGTPILFSPIAVHYAVPKGKNADVLAALDRNLALWKETEGSFYRRRLHYWFGGEEFEVSVLPRWLLWGVLAGILVVASLVLHNRVLESRVKARTQELISSERRLRAILDNSVQLAGLLRPSGEVVHANLAALSLAGVEESEVLGVLFWDCPWWQHDIEMQEKLKDAVRKAAAGSSISFDATHATPSGEVRYIDFSIKPVFDAEGKVELLVPEGRDVTARRALEGELRQAQKMEAVGTLAGGIAHDFNNILTAIVGSAELARSALDDPKEVEAELDRVLQGADRARELVQQILTFSRKRQPETRYVELADVVEESMGLLRSSLPASIKIVRDIGTRGPIRGDAAELQRLLMNLSTNAWHAMPEGGTLTVRLAEKSHPSALGEKANNAEGTTFVVLAVEDTGAGMGPDTVLKIFEPYFSTKGPSRGTGLGLAVAHGIVKASGGWIEVDSQEGRGTRFEIWLPLERGVSAATSSTSVPQQLEGSERVLVLDDEAINVDVMCAGLGQLGYRVDGFYEPETALKVVRRNPECYQVVLVDVTMPGMGGLEVVQEIRAIAGANVVILLWSGLLEDEVVHHDGARLVDKIIQKPVPPNRVAAAIRQALDAGEMVQTA